MTGRSRRALGDLASPSTNTTVIAVEIHTLGHPTLPGRPAQASLRRRAVLMVPAGVCLLAGLDAALLLLDLPAPVRLERLPQVHGMLMVLGFVGTLVALERSIAAGRAWGYLAPGCLGLGGLLLLSPLDLRAGQAVLAAGAVGLLAVYRQLWRCQASDAMLAQAGGALAAAGAAVLWLGGVDVPALLPWLVAFVVLTIAGERLELARVVVLTPRSLRTYLSAVGLVVVACPASLLWPQAGTALAGLALLLLSGWLVIHDVARRTVRATGATRYLAACLLAGYAWLAVAGGLWLLGGPAPDGPRYDAVVHSVFLGFTMSMIMAHAPVILPAVLRRPLPYHPTMWVPVGALHLSLAVRIGVGDARALTGWWQTGGLLGILAVLGFAAVAARSASRGTEGNGR